jgi:hypothetical protein
MASGERSSSGSIADKHTDPMRIGQEAMPKTADVPVDDLDNTRFPKLGETSFETAKADSDSSGSTSGASWSGAEDNAKGASTPTGASPASNAAGAPTTAPTTMAPINTRAPASTAGAQREIIEADIVQAQGDILYVLNRYRGLVLIDMTQPDQPSVIGRAPFQAQPVDMYLRDGKAYIVMSDYFVYWQFCA